MPRGDFQKTLGNGRVCVGRARSAYWGPSLDLAPHRNLAVTIALGLDQPFSLRFLGPSSRWRRAHVALIPSGQMHHLRATGWMAFVYLDPLSDDHRELTSRKLRGADQQVRALLLQQPAATVDDVCAVLGIPRRTIADARVARVLRALEAKPEQFQTIADAARMASLSPARFRALFQQHVGLPFRRYRLWRRMAVVARQVREGRSLTQAALAAGFSSSAHLSSAFLEMFGISPSGLLALDIQIDAVLSLRQGPPPPASERL